MAKEEKKEEAPAEKVELTPEAAAAKAKKRKLIIMIAGGAVLTAAIGGGLAFFLSGGDTQMAAKPGVDQPAPSAEHGAKPAGNEAAAPAKGAKAEAAKAGSKGEAAKAGEPGAAPATAGAASNVDFGCTTVFQPFHLNLGNPLENRYVRLEIAVEYGCSEELKAEIDKRLPQLRDAIISVTSRRTREFLLGPDGKEQLRKEIYTRINHYMSRNVDDVYITDILIE